MIALTRDNRLLVLLSAFLVLAFLTGGGGRSDVLSLVLLRPVAAAVLVIGLAGLRRSHIKTMQLPFLVLAAMALLVIVHLIPLPPVLWQALPGRDLVMAVDQQAGLGALWRPLTLTPLAAWNALASLLVPAAVLIVGAQLDAKQGIALLALLVGFGLVSALLGLLQAIGDPNGPLYLYRVTNYAAAVGLFANRNHQAMLLATIWPMLAVFVQRHSANDGKAKFRYVFAATAALPVVPLILITGSRAGILLGVAGLAASVLLLRGLLFPGKKRPTARKINFVLVGGAIAAAMIALVTIVLARADSFNRLVASNQVDEQRLKFWGPVFRLAGDYFPLGSGIGSFVEAYQVAEPNSQLSNYYLNHAHSDYLEIAMTAGLPGIVLVVIGVAALVARSVRVWRDAEPASSLVGKLGSVIVVMLLIGSIADYPLRVPSLQAVFVVAVLWLFHDRSMASTSANKDPTPASDSRAVR